MIRPTRGQQAGLPSQMQQTTAQPIASVRQPAVASPPRAFAFVAPRHLDGSDWPWLSQIGPMRRHRFKAVYIQNNLKRFQKATRPYIRWQYVRAMRAIQDSELAFMFSTDISMGMTQWPSRLFRQPKRIYVGFTQDGPWDQKKLDRIGRALRQFDAVTVFSEDERQLYIKRYSVDPSRLVLIPIHTDETEGYPQYPDTRPREAPYVLSLGSPNRRFTPIARACHALGVPLVIITRPWHSNDSLDELAKLGATIITDADKMKSLTYLKHAKFMVMSFQTPELPGAFTTLIHGMFMRTPSVVTSCLGIGDYVVDGQTGYVTPHGDEAALKAAIERLWNDDALVDRFAHAGYERAEANYSLEAAAVSFESLAQRVLSEQ